MKLFKVTYRREIREVVEIEADTAEEARKKALEYDYDDEAIEIDCLEMNVIYVKEIE